jgi:hypothetical protein
VVNKVTVWCPVRNPLQAVVSDPQAVVALERFRAAVRHGRSEKGL